MNSSCQINVRLPARPEAASLARSALESVAKNKARPEVLEDARLLLSEIVTNSVRHAHLPPETPIKLSLSLTPHKLRAEVYDPGPGFDRGSFQRKRDQIGGWGLGIVERVADRWGVQKSGEICVWFEIDAPVEREKAWGDYS